MVILAIPTFWCDQSIDIPHGVFSCTGQMESVKNTSKSYVYPQLNDIGK